MPQACLPVGTVLQKELFDGTMQYLCTPEAFDDALLQWKTYVEKFDIQHTVPVQHVLRRSRELLLEMLEGRGENPEE